MYTVKKLGNVQVWDEESAGELLELCSKTQLYTPMYDELDADLSTWGVNQELCKRLYNYVSKFF